MVWVLFLKLYNLGFTRSSNEHAKNIFYAKFGDPRFVFVDVLICYDMLHMVLKSS